MVPEKAADAQFRCTAQLIKQLLLCHKNHIININAAMQQKQWSHGGGGPYWVLRRAHEEVRRPGTERRLFWRPEP